MVSSLVLVLFTLVSVCLSALPSWTATYDLARSTIMQPCNLSGWFDPVFSSQFGIVDYDWSNAKMDWANQKPMDCEERLVKQAALVKKINPDTKIFVYRNLVKALPWFSTVREKISDPAYSGWFLHFKKAGPYHVPQCTDTQCSSLYHDQEQTPHNPTECHEACDCGGVPCGEYLWDHRNMSLRPFIIKEFVLGKNGLGNPLISGLFLDDFWTNYPNRILPWEPKIGYCDHSPIGGPTEENYYCTEDMGLTLEDTTALMEQFDITTNAVHEAINAAGGYSWDQFTTVSAPDKKSCSGFFQAGCGGKMDDVALMQNLNWVNGTLLDLTVDLVTFLLVRGPYAWLGYGWSGCSSGTQPPGGSGYPFIYPSEFKVDYGTPIGHCEESKVGSNVWKRQWTKVSVTMDCNSYVATIVEH